MGRLGSAHVAVYHVIILLSYIYTLSSIERYIHKGYKITFYLT